MLLGSMSVLACVGGLMYDDVMHHTVYGVSCCDDVMLTRLNDVIARAACRPLLGMRTRNMKTYITHTIPTTKRLGSQGRL